MLKKLNELNKFEVKSVHSEDFVKYGKVLTTYDFKEVLDYLEQNTEIPTEGNLYVANDDNLLNMKVSKVLKENLYGDMEIQVGYCNGKNSTLNGLEYHKGSEVNVFLNDGVLFLGHTTKIKDNYYDIHDIESFYVEKGTSLEIYQTTMHFAPCKVNDNGFKVLVILPKHTNIPLTKDIIVKEKEDKLLFMRNKWLIAHPNRTPLIEKGAHGGIIGDNLELLYK